MVHAVPRSDVVSSALQLPSPTSTPSSSFSSISLLFAPLLLLRLRRLPCILLFDRISGKNDLDLLYKYERILDDDGLVIDLPWMEVEESGILVELFVLFATHANPDGKVTKKSEDATTPFLVGSCSTESVSLL